MKRTLATLAAALLATTAAYAADPGVTNTEIKIGDVNIMTGAASFIVGIAGALISIQIRFVNIDVFALILSIEALAIIILGGLGSIAGAILGALFLSFLPDAIRLFFDTFADPGSNFYTSYVYEIRGIVYGVVIILFLRLKPDGLIGMWRDIRKYWSNWPLAY